MEMRISLISVLRLLNLLIYSLPVRPAVYLSGPCQNSSERLRLRWCDACTMVENGQELGQVLGHSLVRSHRSLVGK